MNTDLNRELPPDETSWHEHNLKQQSALVTNFDEGGLNLGWVADAMRRRLWLLILTNAIVLGGAIAWNRTRPPAYEGSFKILIEPVTAESQVVSALKGNQSTVEEQDVGNAQSSKTTLDYPTQIQLLLSEKLLAPVVQKLKPSRPNISYPQLKASLRISRLKESSDTKILEVQYRSGSAKEAKQVLDLVADAYIQYSLSERQTNVRRAVQFVDSQMPKVQAQVTNLELALQTFREQNQLVDPATLGSQLGAQTSTTQQEQLTTQVELDKAKELYRSLQQQLQLQPKGAEAASVLSEAPGYQQLVKQIQDLDVELKAQTAQFTEEHPRIIFLREKRAKLLPLLQQQAKSMLGDNLSQSVPNAQALPYQNRLRQDLIGQMIAADTQVKVLAAKLNGLNAASQTLATQTGKLPILSRQYETLQRQLKTATEQLNKFSQKREELMINAARQEVPWDLIAKPKIDEIPSSSLVQTSILGSCLGLILGIGIVLLLEAMNDVIYSLKDLREELPIPILGMIPDREDEQKSLDSTTNIDRAESITSIYQKDPVTNNNYYRFSPFIESFRALNSQLGLLNPDAPIRSLVISSSLPGEGKTTIAIQLAQAAAAMGQRVLLVNADLRKSSLQNLANHDRNEPPIYGLTDVIEERSQLMDAIQRLPGEENLYFLLSGSIGLDPTNILSSSKMQQLMKKCQHHFDLVIYDSVPLCFADSLLLIPHTDGLLMVTRLGTVNRKVLRNSLRTLQVSKVNVLGLVVNMIAEPSQFGVKAYAPQEEVLV